MQSQAITSDTIKVSGIPFLKTLLDIQISIIPSEHGKMIITGYGDTSETLPSIQKKFFGQTAELIHEENPDKPIFSGIITKCQVIAEHELKLLEVTVLTGSYLLDTKRKSRSFQDISMTYEDVVRKVLQDTNGAGIFSVGKDIPIGSPIIQYLETDWEFIKRLASHFNSPIIADPTIPKANIWFGINEQGKNATFENENLHYKVGVSENYYIEDGMSSGLTPIDFIYFTVKSMNDYNIGDNTEVNGTDLKICEKHACFERAILEFSYILGKPDLISRRIIYNEKITGMSLTGTVTETDAETVNIKLDIDGDNGSADYPYHWTPTSGNLMYAMPRVGTQVSLLLPNEDERCAKATNSPRDEETSSTCSGMDDYNYRAFTTEHNKKMFLFPDSMGFIGTGRSSDDDDDSNTGYVSEDADETQPEPLWIKLTDFENMLFKSHNAIMILANDDVEFKAPNVSFYVPSPEKTISVMRTVRAEGFEPFIIGIGSASTLPFNSSDFDDEDDDSDDDDDEVLDPCDYTFLILHSRFDVTGDHGIFQGRIHGYHEPFEDAPQEGEFSLGRSIFRAIVVGVAVAAVAVAVVATGGVALAVIGLKVGKVLVTGAVVKGAMIGAAMGAGMAAVGVLIHDVRTGNNSSWSDYVRAASIGALTGAISGGLMGKLQILKVADMGFLKKVLIDMAIGSITGAATSAVNVLANAALEGTLFSMETLDSLWRETLRGAVVGGISGGVGGRFAAKWGMCASKGSFKKKFLARTVNAGIGGATGAVSGGLTNALIDTGSQIISAIRAGEEIDWFALGQQFGDSFQDGAIMGFISGAVSGALRAEPINAVFGFVCYDSVAFEYPGVIPLVWKRSWYSRNISQSPSHFGYGSGFAYGVYLTHEEDCILFVDSNSLGTPFRHLAPNQADTNRKSKMTLFFDGEKYEIFNHEERLYYVFEKKPNANIHHLTQIATETREHRILLAYNAQHNLSTITDTAGRVFNITTTSTGQITQVQLNNKTLVKYIYSEANDLIQVTDVSGKSAYFTYDESHLLIRRTTMEGTAFTWEYAGEGHNAKCIHTTGDDHLLEYWFDYHPDHTIVTNSLGHKEIFHFTEDKTLTKLVHENGYATIYEHNEYSEITSITNADGETVKMSYNEFGQLTELIQPNGGTHKIEYDKQGRIIKSITPSSTETTWSYDEIGRISQSTSVTGETTFYTYDDKGMVTELITKEGEAQLKTSLQYDDSLNVTQISYANGAVETWEYDPEGNCVKATNPLGAIETMNYDQSNRLTRHTSDDGNTTNFKYNAYDDVVWMKDNEREIRFTYSPLGSLTSRIEQHRKIKLQYDTEEQLTHVYNEAGEEYSFERDPMGNVTIETGYDGVRKLYVYTPAGKLKGLQRGASANWIRMKYGKDGFLSKIIYDDGTISKEQEEEIFTHGIMGELLTAENKHSKLEFEYDKLGNVIKEVQNGHVIESNYSKDHAYVRTNLKTSLGLNVDTSLNKFGQTEEILASFNPINSLPITKEMETGAIWQASQTYNMVGQLLERTISTVIGTTAQKSQGEIKDSWSYDRQGRPTQQKISINQRESSKRQYTWGIRSKLKSIIDDVANMGLEYSYDSFGNPQKETLKGAKTQETIRYLDDVGQVYETKSKIDRKYGKGGQLMVSKHRKYKYNDCGDLIEKVEADGKTWQYKYNVNGLMKSVTRPDGKAVYFTYDAMARRISKTFNDTTTRYVWDGNQIIHEWAEQKIIPETNPTVTPISTWLFENGSFTPIAKLTERNAYTIITDHLGTPTKMLDVTGKNAWSETFNLWGRQHNETQTTTIGKAKIIKAKFKLNEPEQPTTPNQETDNPFRFPGQYEDMETGLYYNRFRYYMPNEGLYTQRDPIGIVGDNPTVYGYVFNSLSELDPLGLIRAIPPLRGNRRNAQALRRNLQREGRPVGQGQAAAHIVASSGSQGHFAPAVQSRAILARYGIWVNDAANGIPMDTPNPHGFTHRGEYHNRVLERLQAVEDRMLQEGYGDRAIRKALRKELRRIGRDTEDSLDESGGTSCVI